MIKTIFWLKDYFFGDWSKKEWVLDKLKTDGLLIAFASDELRNTKKIAIAALNQNLLAYDYIGEKLKKNKKIWKIILKNDKSKTLWKKVPSSLIDLQVEYLINYQKENNENLLDNKKDQEIKELVNNKILMRKLIRKDNYYNYYYISNVGNSLKHDSNFWLDLISDGIPLDKIISKHSSLIDNRAFLREAIRVSDWRLDIRTISEIAGNKKDLHKQMLIWGLKYEKRSEPKDFPEEYVKETDFMKKIITYEAGKKLFLSNWEKYRTHWLKNEEFIKCILKNDVFSEYGSKKQYDVFLKNPEYVSIILDSMSHRRHGFGESLYAELPGENLEYEKEIEKLRQKFPSRRNREAASAYFKEYSALGSKFTKEMTFNDFPLEVRKDFEVAKRLLKYKYASIENIEDTSLKTKLLNDEDLMQSLLKNYRIEYSQIGDSLRENREFIRKIGPSIRIRYNDLPPSLQADPDFIEKEWNYLSVDSRDLELAKKKKEERQKETENFIKDVKETINLFNPGTFFKTVQNGQSHQGYVNNTNYTTQQNLLIK